MSVFRNWKWGVGLFLLLAYLAIVLIVFIINALNSSTPIASYPTAIPTPNNQSLMINARNQKRWMQTLYHIESASLQQSWTPDLHRQAGDVWWNMGDITRAIPYWSGTLEFIQDNDLLRTVANTYINLGEWTLARQTIDQLLKAKPDDEWGNYQMGMILAPFNPVKARLFFDVVTPDSPFYPQVVVIRNEIDQNTADPLISFRIGLSLINLKLWHFAELALKHASDISYPNPQVLAYLGWVKSKQGKDGTLWIEQSTQLAPEDPNVWFLRGLHFRAQTDYIESLNALTQSAKLAPENAAVYAELGMAFRLIGNLEQAEYWLDYAVTLSANTPEYQQILENFFIEAAYVSPNNILDSLGNVAQNTTNADLLSAYGWALHLSGNTSEGLEQVENALKIDPNNPRALLDKASILIDMERQLEAIPLLQKVAQTYTPFGTQAEQVLRNLQSP